MSHTERGEKVEARVEAEFKREVRVTAAKAGMPMSEFIRTALRREIERMDSEDEEGEGNSADGEENLAQGEA